jgi:hypothetical protein
MKDEGGRMSQTRGPRPPWIDSAFILSPSFFKKWPSPHGEDEGRTYIRESRAASTRSIARSSGRAWPFTGLPRIAVATYRGRGMTSDGNRRTELWFLCSGWAAPIDRLRVTQRPAPSPTSARWFLHSCLPKQGKHSRKHSERRLL